MEEDEMEEDEVEEKELLVSVPGRICLLGEHSDWAAQIGDGRGRGGRGAAVVFLTGKSLSIEATVRKRRDDLLCISAVDNNGRAVQDRALEEWQEQEQSSKYGCVLKMEDSELEACAASGKVWSYAAGAARALMIYVRNNFKDVLLGGAEIINNRTTLPTKAGLSSSAAICVLVIRALSMIHGITLDEPTEMELAYQGERMTPSSCGRLDQVCVARFRS